MSAGLQKIRVVLGRLDLDTAIKREVKKQKGGPGMVLFF